MVSIIWEAFTDNTEDPCDFCGKMIAIGTTVKHKVTGQVAWLCNECLEKLL